MSMLIICVSPLLKSMKLLILFLSIMILFSMNNLLQNDIMIPNNLIFLDVISSSMLILTIFIIMMILVSSESFRNINSVMIIMLMILSMTFLAKNMLMFYVMFEMVLIPTFFLIMKEGSQPEKIQASLYIILYTITASLPLLICMITLNSSLMFFILETSNKNINYGILMMLAFLVKMPMFFTHLWLPKAHVQAPVEGSMILAAILLKLGGYGLMRMIPISLKSISKMSPWLMSLSLIGSVITSLICLRQKDMKSLIAYSSVSHMALVISSLFSTKPSSSTGSLMMMIGHGMSSSMLFYFVNLIYNQMHTRSTLMFKGMLNSQPNLNFLMFLMLMINMSIPPSINLFSEIMIMTSVLSWNYSTSMLILLSSFSTASFCVFFYMTFSNYKSSFILTNTNIKKKYIMMIMIHMIPLFLMTMKMEIMAMN